jgi:hypothetical protein
MAMSYAQALSIYNQGKNEWCNPKKGTAEYDKVKAIQMSDKEPLPSKPAKAKRARKSKAAGSSASIGVDASTQTAGGRMRAGRPRNVAPDLVMPPPAVAIQPKPRGRPKKNAV